MDRQLTSAFCLFTITGILLHTITAFPFQVAAKEKTVELIGNNYEFAKDSEYEIDSDTPLPNARVDTPLGALSLDGDITKEYKYDGFAAYELAENTLFTLCYDYDDTLASAAETEQHLIDDNKKVVNSVKLDKRIKKGALLLQTSLDGENWVTQSSFTNISEDMTLDTADGINTAQLINGCWYRVIVAYETGKKTEGSFNIFDVFNNSASFTEKRKFAEVYRFFANYPAVEGSHPQNMHIYNTNEYTSKTKQNDYLGSEATDKNDPHKGWELGKFVLSGYTSVSGEDESIFQKTLGDRIELRFHLEQDITKLDGNDALTIIDDEKGYDGDTKLNQKPHDMGHGELIIWHKLPNGETKITAYANYLEALASPNADTSIVLYEEGDYEIHLDYGVKDSKKVGAPSYYRTSIRFQIVNGNVMGFLFDAANGRELFDTDRTENGFMIDNANSQSLNIHVTRKVLQRSTDGWTLDTRSNKAVSDGDAFKDEGLYEITWMSRRDGASQTNTKTLYVGSSETIEKYKNYMDHGTIEAITTAPPATTRRATTTTTRSTTAPKRTTPKKTDQTTTTTKTTTVETKKRTS